ncbi:MAG: hypothetical protein R2722_07365 [Tessaracoccus sp.]
MPGQSPLLEQASDAPTRIARVAVDVSLAHLDRLFDYEIPLPWPMPLCPAVG